MLNQLTAITISALLMLAAACGLPEYPRAPEHPWKAHILASSLRSAYLDNPVRFRLEYRGDAVSAHGKVRRIRLDGKVEFRKGFLFPGDLVCTFEDQQVVAGLGPGNQIMITGTVQNVDGWYVHLTGCGLVE